MSTAHGARRWRPYDRAHEIDQCSIASLVAATPLTAASAFADARKPWVSICEGVVQLGFFIDGTVSIPVGKTRREKAIGHYMFTDSAISNACPEGSTCRVTAPMRGGNQFQILSVFGVATPPDAPYILAPKT